MAEDDTNLFAKGFQELIDWAVSQKKHLIIVFDSDRAVGVKPQVQRAAATMAFELRFRGVPFDRIRQLVLPLPSNQLAVEDDADAKVGLDDFIVADGPEALKQLIADTIGKRSAFPRYPSLMEFVNRRLQKSKPTRREVQQVSLAILSDMDANGMRLRSSSEGQTYYFDFSTRKLLRAEFNRDDIHDTPFGQFLYRSYGLSSADSRTKEWLAAQFTGENPVGNVSPYRVIARTRTDDDSVIYQLSDSQYARVDANGLEIYDNGTNGILFESEQVEPLDVALLMEQFDKQQQQQSIKPEWMETLSTVRLRDKDKQRTLTALLYYISPYLYRWRGMQLPMEMVVGEPGSGKSSLMELRLTILNGHPRLRNAPADLKDWHASISNSGGLHVTDNVQLVDASLRQRLSDEICRVITEPNPSVEMRKYYTNADLVRIPVRATFAFTSIRQPFQNADVIQRSIITDFEKLERDADGNPLPTIYDSAWRVNQIKRMGGREAWVAHQLLVLQRFFQAVQKKWDPNYRAAHRLINFEQSVLLMAEVLGIENDWIAEYLSTLTDNAVAKADWVFEGLSTFALMEFNYRKDKTFPIQEICDFFDGKNEFEKNEILTNPRKLSHYMQTHKTMVAQVIGLVEAPARGNKTFYRLVRPKKDQKKSVERPR